MQVGNRIVCLLLESPLRRLLSGSTAVVRYQGRRTGQTFATPTQYAAHGDGLVILVGRAATKSWWRNFREDYDLEVLVAGEWRPMVGRAVLGVDEPDVIAPLLRAYLERFPKASRVIEGSTGDGEPEATVVVWCRPR